ncbi:MAG TPA: LysR substrate-binding domain-containing protein [Aldersonia sp.]
MADEVPRYTMRQLAAFVAVAETGTISGAAARLHLSQSALSAAITDLEKALAAQLCVRKRAHGVGLTPTGESVLARARALLRQANEIQADAHGESGGVAGPVTVGCYPSLGPTILPPLLHGFTRRHPRASVEFREDTQNRLRKQMDGGELDVCIVYDLDLSPEWRTEVLARRVPQVVLAADHPLAAVSDGCVGIDLADLAQEPLVLLDAPPSSNHALDACRRAGFAPQVAYRTGNYETARAFVGHGLGWTLLLQRPAVDMTYEGRAVVVREITTPELPLVAIVVAWHRDMSPSRVTRAFIDFATEHHSSDLPNM